MSLPLLIGASLLLAAVACGIACAIVAPKLPAAVRVFATLMFLPLLLFSVFGFLASFEPGDGHLFWRLIYVAMFVLSLMVMGRLLWIRRSSD